jgi:hypothetical protein
MRSALFLGCSLFFSSWVDTQPGPQSLYATEAFEIAFSGEVKVDTRQPGSDLVLQATDYMQSGSGHAYLLSAVHYRSPADVEIATIAALSKLGCKLNRPEESPAIKGIRAFDVNASNCDGGLALQSRTIATGSWLYLVMALYDSTTESTIAARQFVNSFRLRKVDWPDRRVPRTYRSS